MEFNIGDQVSSKELNNTGTVIKKTNRSITIKWSKMTQKITFKDKIWDWSDWDYKKV